MTTELKPYRIVSIDILRGLIMVIMALDHVRDFFFAHGMDIDPLDLEHPSRILFFTRWITHFCAPLFVFLSGISAYLSINKGNSSGSAAFLIRRGLFLIAMELVVVTFGITFNPLYNVIILQVIWAIGISLVILGLLTRFSRAVILTVGILLVFGHDVLDFVDTPTAGFSGFVMQLLLTSKTAFFPLGHNYFVAILYAALPWTGVMLLGYCVGDLFQSGYPVEKRKKWLLILGSGALALFAVLRLINMYGDPSPWHTQMSPVFTFLSFLKVSKYPPSLLYCLMTVGSGLIILSLTENLKNGISKVLTHYGRVPFFYYLAHFYLLHLVLIILFFATGYGVNDIIPKNNPFLFRPDAFGFSLPIVYLIWITIVAMLYRPCVWYWDYKKRHKEKWWTRYV
jgi:uncharacterized membrane protein